MHIGLSCVVTKLVFCGWLDRVLILEVIGCYVPVVYYVKFNILFLAVHVPILFSSVL